MTILSGDIQLLKSQVMTDANNGGGAATGVVVIDGKSNDIFPDISELDHVYGRVSLRKVFVGIHTANTDTYLGANVILSKPPSNPEVSAVLFSTKNDFDVRTDAASRIEAYLNVGPAFNGYLFGNHIQGQMTLLVQQRVGTAPPNVGDTLDLVVNQGLTNEYSQYVRIIDVQSTTRTFTTSTNSGIVDFQRQILTLTLSDALASDFPGFDPIYLDATVSYVGKTKVFETVVANAATYYGIVPLTSAASFGDYGVTGDGIFTQLVPSSRTEVAIPDARINQSIDALISTGSVANFQLAGVLSPASPFFVGGGITPGSFSISASGVTLTDKGGTLINASGTEIGTVDYANGVLAVSAAVYGTNAQNFTINYTKAVSVSSVANSMGQKVTAATRRLTWVVTFDSIPAPGSLSVSYLAQGVWYVLQDDGTGALRGTDVSFGAGVLNPATGTASITLGALPDAPSEIIYTWANGEVPAALNVKQEQVGASTAAATINISTGFTNISVGGLTLTWEGHTVTDSTGSPGQLAGYGTGTVNYKTGEVVLIPTTLPTPGATIVCTATNLATGASGSLTALVDGGASLTANVGPGVLPGSFRTTVNAAFPLWSANMTDVAGAAAFAVSDDGHGVLRSYATKTDGTLVMFNCGTINYSTGAIAFPKTIANVVVSQPHWSHGFGAQYNTFFPDGNADRTVTLTVRSPDAVGSGVVQTYTYNVASAPGATLNYVVSAIQVTANISSIPTSTLVPAGTQGFQTFEPSTVDYGTLAPGATFNIAGHRYYCAANLQVLKDASGVPAAGGAAGTWSSSGVIHVTDWTAGAAPTLSLFSASENPATLNGATSLTTTTVTFRTATSPLASAGFSIRGKMADGTAFNVTAASDGSISGAPVFGNVDYDTGVITLVFGATSVGPASDSVADVSDLSIPGVSFVALKSVDMDSLVYDAVAYSYLPLDPSILGLNPVRLPSDGRVPIFKKGEVAVVHYTHTLAAATHANGDSVNVGQTRLSVLNVYGYNGVEITTGFSANLDTGVVSITNVAGWSQPVTMTWRIEDAALVTDAQISGHIQLSRPLSHNYPLGSYVSSAFLIGDMQASVPALFEQQTWTSTWQDTPIGNPILAGYDSIDHPPAVTNAAAVTESWALIFTSNTAFNIVGQHLGTVGVGNTSTDCAPLNPNTGTPYFSLAAAGFGAGWSAGNVIRINTIGALEPLWLARVVQQGDNTLNEDSFTVLVRGDVDA